MAVADIEVDITNYSGRRDFFVYTEYIDTNSYNIVVRRLDSSGDGWTEGLKVFVIYKNGTTNTILVGSSKEQEKRVNVITDFPIERSNVDLIIPPSYVLQPYPEPQYLNRTLFNKLFHTNIVTLPKNIIAVGVRKGCTYIYCESNEFIYMIELTIKHIVSVALTKNLFNEFYFLICTHDGYMENHYLSTRTNPKQIGDEELKNKVSIVMENPDEYANLHKDLYVLAQSNQKGMTNVINVPDRYYFYLNRYNEYRSIHQGIPFTSKKNKIVFGSQPRGTKFNFTKRRDIEVSPREYFNKTVPKDNIICPDWIPQKDMIGYKYILDVDGNSSTWDATAWKLNSGSVIMKSDSPWVQWFYGDYLPWVHYVPIADDFSDIQEKFLWCESHQNECEIMITKCKELFKKAYTLNNVIESTTNNIYTLNNLVPYTLEDKRIFFIRNSERDIPGLNMPRQLNGNHLDMVSTICRKLHPSDIIVYLNPTLTDMNNFELSKLLNAYKSYNSKIVFGAEKNLWPEKLEELRYKIENITNSQNDFKYLNAGFYIAEVGEMSKLLDECMYVIDQNEQEYFSRALVTKRYSLTTDTQHKLVLNTYKCSNEEINRKKEEGVPFINYNAGR